MSDVTSLPTTQPAATADAADLGVVEAGVLLRAGRLSAVELTEACLSRIEERNGDCAALLDAMAAGTAAVTPLLPPPTPLGPIALAARSGPRPLDGVTVALTDRVNKINIDDQVGRRYEQAMRECERLGARLVEPAASVGVSLIAPRGREAALTQVAIDLQEHALGIPDDPLNTPER